MTKKKIGITKKKGKWRKMMWSLVTLATLTIIISFLEMLKISKLVFFE
jgi:hypothetical protein